MRAGLPCGVLRTALQPRWLALLALALALATAFAALGSWQLERSRARPAPGPQADVVRDLDRVIAPQTAFTSDTVRTPVRATGVFRGSDQLLVVGRERDGRDGSWVLTPFEVEADGATGASAASGAAATLPVVRGWVPAGAAAPPAPSGRVTLEGRLQGSEPATGGDAAGGELPAGQIASVSSADLVNLWHPPIYAGYLVASEPAPVAPLLAVKVEPVDEGGGFHLLNLSYALQWWVFALFAVFLWWRTVRDSHLEALAQGEGEAAPAEGENGGSRAERGARS